MFHVIPLNRQQQLLLPTLSEKNRRGVRVRGLAARHSEMTLLVILRCTSGLHFFRTLLSCEHKLGFPKFGVLYLIAVLLIRSTLGVHCARKLPKLAQQEATHQNSAMLGWASSRLGCRIPPEEPQEQA